MSRVEQGSAVGSKLARCPSGVPGLDEITFGGLPRGRSTLVSGGPGCGKTLLGLQFLVQGIELHNEPGVFVSFEVRPEDLRLDAASIGFELASLERTKKLAILDMHIDRTEIEETGLYDLGGLFVRLEHAIDSIGATRVTIDTLEMLFSAFENEVLLRSEIRRLFDWLKDKGVTSIVTAEAGKKSFTRQGLEEYVSDCVIVLDHRVTDQIATRRLRIVKFRGSNHGTWEYPFLIDERGISVVPITSIGLQHEAPQEFVSTGVAELDEMLGHGGFYRGSTILLSGAAGTGKSSLSASFACAAAERGEKALYFAFEESRDQIVRNMTSIGIDLRPHVDSGLIRIEAVRPAMHGLEHHLTRMYTVVEDFKPSVIVLDPITDFEGIGSDMQTKAMMTRMIDYVKSRRITTILTSLSRIEEDSVAAISSLVDTWLQVRNLESDGERNRALYVLKSRGMAHSNKVREFVLSDDGIQLLEVYVGRDGVLIGSARMRAVDAEKSSADE